MLTAIAVFVGVLVTELGYGSALFIFMGVLIGLVVTFLHRLLSRKRREKKKFDFISRHKIIKPAGFLLNG